MNNVLIVRRRGLGHQSTLGVQSILEQKGHCTTLWRSDRHPPLEKRYETILRWGCSATLPMGAENRGFTVNKARAMHLVNNKRTFAQMLGQTQLGPRAITGLTQSSGEYPMVLRPEKHAQGRRIWEARNQEHLEHLVNRHIRAGEGWYARPKVNKVAEYRYYVVCGRVVAVAKKTPADPNALAWNVAQGGRFDNCRWGDWHLDGARVAVEAFNLSGLEFSGIDVMIDEEDKAWVIEANSAPSLPFNSDGTVTYRHKCMANAFDYHIRNDWNSVPLSPEEGWRKYIHPSIYSR